MLELMLSLVLVQDGEKKAPAKEQAPGPMLQVAEVDTNGDGWISAAELKAALAKLGGGDGGPKKGGEKDGFKKPAGEGDGVKKVKPEGQPGDPPVKKIKPEGEGDGVKKPGPKDGENPKKGPKDGERKEGDKEGEKK